MNDTINVLRRARSLVSGPQSWVTGVGHIIRDGTPAFCMNGAIIHAQGYQRTRAASLAVHAVLSRRFDLGTLPPPTFAGGNSPGRPWHEMILAPEGSIAQFNNSTSQAEVLALFDETIADLEAQEPKPVPAPVKVRELELA